MTPLGFDDLLRVHTKAIRLIEARIDDGTASAADMSVLARLLSEMNVLAAVAVPVGGTKQDGPPGARVADLPFTAPEDIPPIKN